MPPTRELNLKFLLVGDAMVGKTAYSLVLLKKGTQTAYKATIGADMSLIHREIDNTTLNIYLWDVAGQDRFQNLYPVFFKQANVAMIVFDLNSPKSFERIDSFVEHINNHARVVSTGEDIPLVLIGNKCDLLQEISDEDINAIVEKHKFLAFFKTSALTGDGVVESFNQSASRVFEFYKDREVPTNSIDLRAGAKNGSSGCFGFLGGLRKG